MSKTATSLKTPQGRELTFPTQSLEEAVRAEVGAKDRPLTKLCYTAVDIAAEDADLVIDSLLAYLDTDTMCYYSENPELQKLEEEAWRPVTDWVQRRYDCSVDTTIGLMPLNQPAETHDRLRAVLQSLSPWELAGVTSLTQLYASLLLALAVFENQLDAETAWIASRIDEEAQAEQWGRDEEAQWRVNRFKDEMFQAAKFLNLVR